VSKKLFIGNLSFKLQEGDLARLFEPYGAVESVRLMMDRETGRSKGFAFVEFADDGAAQKAIEELNGKEVQGRALRVDEAKDRPPRRDGPGGGRGRGPRY
jgi:RNA recognition motif-containing protein